MAPVILVLNADISSSYNSACMVYVSVPILEEMAWKRGIYHAVSILHGCTLRVAWSHIHDALSLSELSGSMIKHACCLAGHKLLLRAGTL